jgi:glycosyltransferase involved in cell wall biosynthesis
MTGSISVIIPSLNEGTDLRKTVSNIIDTIGLDNYEIIIVNSGGTEISEIMDLPIIRIINSEIRFGVAQARNYGSAQASGDILLFADAHIHFKDRDWATKFINSLENGNAITAPCISVMGDEKNTACGFRWNNIDMQTEWLPNTIPYTHEIPYAGAACMALKKKIFDKIGKFDPGNRYYGSEDSEISMRAWLLGYNIVCDPSIKVSHKFKQFFPYKVEWFDIYYNKVRLAFSHLKSERLINYLDNISQVPDFNKILLMVLGDNVLERREVLFDEREHTDDWFFEKFQMNGWSQIKDDK